jgi:hypothetical protein
MVGILGCFVTLFGLIGLHAEWVENKEGKLDTSFPKHLKVIFFSF